MNVESITKIKEEIDTLKSAQVELFKAGYQEGWKKKTSMVATILLILLGITGVMDVLYRGLTWLSAIFIALGAIALYRGIESDNATKAIREQYQKNRSKIFGLEEKYQELTFVHTSPEQIEHDWKEMMRKLDDQTKPTH
ncbi:hypothetical protein F3K50_03460 [Pseudomonas marginalis]|nr:hypothetical protein F3K50_03460 [Pseudomonas marginalis]